MYVTGSSGDDVNEYDLSTAWDISTAVFLQLFSVAGQDTAPLGLFFKPDGLKMYVSGSNADSVYEYDLSTAWDVTTAVYLQNLHVGFEDIIPVGLFFKPDGTRMYFAGSTNDNVYEYEVGNVSTMTLPAAVENTPAQRLRSSTQVTYEFITLDGGTTVTLIGEEAV
jgi:DNA-binding beta-propeller fold protein YncE